MVLLARVRRIKIRSIVNLLTVFSFLVLYKLPKTFSYFLTFCIVTTSRAGIHLFVIIHRIRNVIWCIFVMSVLANNSVLNNNAFTLALNTDLVQLQNK